MERKIEKLLKMPMWQMTGEEFLLLREKYCNKVQNFNPVNIAYGMRNLGDAIGCSLTTVYDLKRKGVLDGAIISFIGRRIAFDVEVARKLASQYKEQQRTQKEQNMDSNC